MTTAELSQLSLDDFQKDVVNAPEGPALIIGGPGTGKTHTLIARIIAMVQQGVPTGHITYLAFNSQGAQEVKRQLDHIGQIQHLFVGSVHQFASYFLRQAGAAALGISPNYTIWDHHQTRDIIDELSQADPNNLGIDPDALKRPPPLARPQPSSFPRRRASRPRGFMAPPHRRLHPGETPSERPGPQRPHSHGDPGPRPRPPTESLLEQVPNPSPPSRRIPRHDPSPVPPHEPSHRTHQVRHHIH